MTLTDKELERLQTLACINLSSQEQLKLGKQLQNIITFLDKLKALQIKNEELSLSDIQNPLRTIE